MLVTTEAGIKTIPLESRILRCGKCNRYFRCLPSKLLRYKHYCKLEIRKYLESVILGEKFKDYSLSCRKTKYNWRMWLKSLWDKVQPRVGGSLPDYVRNHGKQWLDALLNTFLLIANNLYPIKPQEDPTMGKSQQSGQTFAVKGKENAHASEIIKDSG